jgi:hypothetical protein
MRETIFVAFGAAGIGAAAGALLVLALHSPAPPPAPQIDEGAMAAAFERAFGKGVADLRRDLAALREARAEAPVAGAPAAEAPRRRSVDDTAPDPARATRRRSADAAPQADRDSPFDGPGAPPNFERLRKVRGWDDRPELRRTWLFADEATCLEWFGTPNEVNSDGTWFYEELLPDADGDGESDGKLGYVIQFHGGRVFRIDADKPEEK